MSDNIQNKSDERNFDHENKENIITTGLHASFDRDGLSVSEDLMAKTLARIAELDADKQAGGEKVNKYIPDGSNSEPGMIRLAERRRKLRMFTGIAAGVVVAVTGLSLLAGGSLKSAGTKADSAEAMIAYDMMSSTTASTSAPMDAAVYDSMVMETEEADMGELYPTSTEATMCGEELDAGGTWTEGIAEESKSDLKAYANGADWTTGEADEMTGNGYEGENGDAETDDESIGGHMLTGVWSLGSGYSNDVDEDEAPQTTEAEAVASTGMTGDTFAKEAAAREAIPVIEVEFVTEQVLPDAETAYKDGFAFYTAEFFTELLREAADGFTGGGLNDVETGGTVYGGAVYGCKELAYISDSERVTFSFIIFMAEDADGNPVARSIGEGRVCTGGSSTCCLICDGESEWTDGYSGKMDETVLSEIEVNRCHTSGGDIWEAAYVYYGWTEPDAAGDGGIDIYTVRMFFDGNGVCLILKKSNYTGNAGSDHRYHLYDADTGEMVDREDWTHSFEGEYVTDDGAFSLMLEGEFYDRYLDVFYYGELLFHDERLYNGH